MPPPPQVIIPAPYWVSYTEMAVLAGAKPVVISTTPQVGWAAVHVLLCDWAC
jgi:aspartate/methionine/tyrosine aminotransferase